MQRPRIYAYLSLNSTLLCCLQWVHCTGCLLTPCGNVQAMTYAIERSCVNKSEVVSADEREGGVRATLNLGHTFGHAMESSQGYGESPIPVSACAFLSAVLCY